LHNRLQAGLRAPLDYDVFHFYFGKTLLCWDDYLTGDDYRYLESRDREAAWKPVFFTLQGCDVRIAGESTKLSFTACRNDACGLFPLASQQEDDKRRQFFRNPAESGSGILSQSGAEPVCPRGEFLPYSSVDVEAIAVASAKKSRPA